MAWKQINGFFYYYISVRQGSRVRSDYFGSGECATLIAQIEGLERIKRKLRRQAVLAERERDDAEDREFDTWFAQVEAIANAAMLVAGYHKHHRGEWRKRRKPA